MLSYSGPLSRSRSDTSLPAHVFLWHGIFFAHSFKWTEYPKSPIAT